EHDRLETPDSATDAGSGHGAADDRSTRVASPEEEVDARNSRAGIAGTGYPGCTRNDIMPARYGIARRRIVERQDGTRRARPTGLGGRRQTGAHQQRKNGKAAESNRDPPDSPPHKKFGRQAGFRPSRSRPNFFRQIVPRNAVSGFEVHPGFRPRSL